jgi:erythromycin esterase
LNELDEIAALARPLETPADLDPLVGRIGDARLTLLGEASHGTSEYYRWRAEITRRLIQEHGAGFVAVEGDWPDCFRINQWVKGREDQDLSAREVLDRFERWPTWMWANTEVAEFVDWLRDHNRNTAAQVGFYGLDVYSLWESLHRVTSYLSAHLPEAVGSALQAARCFEPYHEDPQRYASATRFVPTSCEDEVVDVLSQIRNQIEVPAANGELRFDAVQNAEVLAGAERYYRTMIRGDGESWNVRDLHMADTLDRVMGHHGSGARGVVWEHNTHVGDARATDMAAAGMLNLGQVVRERYGNDQVVLVGFSGHHGRVIGAAGWGAPMRRMPVPPARAGTHEALIHEVTMNPSLFVFPERRDTPWLTARRGHRAIGVVYRPDHDHRGNWVPTIMGARYDALCSFDSTEALHPLHLEGARLAGEYETYPWSV